MLEVEIGKLARSIQIVESPQSQHFNQPVFEN